MDGLRRFFEDALCAVIVNGITGDYVEFGSAGAKTLPAAYEAMIDPEARHLWAFDSFDTMPEPSDARDDHPIWRPVSGERVGGIGGVDEFHEAVLRAGVPPDAYTVVEGFYEETLPALGNDGAPIDIALAYIDCNMYSSTVTVLEFLAPRLKHGMILAFDDYFCWSPTHMSGEQWALREFLDGHPRWRVHRYRDYHWTGTSFVVEDLDMQGRIHDLS